ncbi:MAG: hypothetical protein ABSH56_00230 [Bryobacteraceae bacterium]|jgi:hypothetical protein
MTLNLLFLTGMDAELHVFAARHFALDTVADEIVVLVQRFAGDSAAAVVGRVA